MALRRVMPLTMVLVLAGCAAQPDFRPPVEERGTPSEPPAPLPPSETMPSSGSVESAPDRVDSRVYMPTPDARQDSSAPVLALLNQADQERRASRYPQALAALERAQRIAPRDPAVYEAMGRLKIAMGDYRQAAQLGMKGLGLNPDARTRAQLEALVREARNKAGTAP